MNYTLISLIIFAIFYFIVVLRLLKANKMLKAENDYLIDAVAYYEKSLSKMTIETLISEIEKNINNQ